MTGVLTLSSSDIQKNAREVNVVETASVPVFRQGERRDTVVSYKNS
jgi:hypothetical protein